MQAAGARVRSAILAAPLPAGLIQAVQEGYRRLEVQYGPNCDVAVRSSATAEDLTDASFAGQQESFLNIHGETMLLDAVRRCYASLFTDRAIVYRVHHGFDHTQVALSVGVQKMVRSDLASAGVMFSIDTETGFSHAVLITGAYGLGESVVQGTVNPDEFYVFKPSLTGDLRPILQKKLGTKEFKLVYEEGGTRQTRSVPVSTEDRERLVLSDDDVLTLARWAVLVERHYSELRGTPTPMDIEWAKDGRTGELFLVQARPETVHTQRDPMVLERFQLVTVSCAEGDDGFVYHGRRPVRIERTNLADLPRPRTHMMMNVANPAEAFSLSLLPNDGVGLARLEFIISTHVRAHPMALLRPGQISDPKQRRDIERLTAGYTDKSQYFVDRLAEGVAMIAAAFWPKDVIVRLSDFKTNEYAGLLGGAGFEPREENPMLGFRGASRYYDERYREGFGLKCRAMRKVREVMGLQNVKLMVPFCRTVEEGRRVIAEMATHGLVQGEQGLEVYVMCEIPSNVTLAAKFAQVFDGFSIGSNDLTQLILGVDRDSELVAHLFDERNDAVTQTIAQVIRAAHAAGRKIGICGQAPSDYPEFAQFLVVLGIDSSSLNPDSVLKTMLAIVEAEKAIGTGAAISGRNTTQPGAAQTSVGPGVMVGTNR